MWGAIASGVGSMLGSLGSSSGRQNRDTQAWFQKQQFELQKDFDRGNIRRKVNDARQAGIHPLYALGASSTSVPAYVSDQSTPGKQSNLAAAGQALASGVGTYIQNKQAARMNNLQAEQIQANIQETKARAVATRVRAMNDARDFALGSAQASIKNSVDSQLVGVGKPRVAPQIVTPVGKLKVDPIMSTSQDVEDRYSDIVGNLYGLGLLGHDIWTKNTGPFYKKQLKKYKRRVDKNMQKRGRVYEFKYDRLNAF